MSIPVPLAVRLVTPRADRLVTRDLRDLSFRENAIGGWASITMSLDRPLSLDPLEFDYYSRCYVYDTRNGAVVCEGRLEDPGRSAADGQIWELAAMGPSAHAQDRTVPLIYVDRGLPVWENATRATPGATSRVSANPGGTDSNDEQVLFFQFPESSSLVTNDRAVLRYWPIQRAGQKLARYDYTWDAGLTSADFEIQGVTRVDGSATGENSRTNAWNVAGGGSVPKVVVTDFPNGRNTLDIRGIRTGGAIGPLLGDAWCVAIDPVVVALRLDASGNEITTGYTVSTVLASQVVADLLGRLLTSYDGAGATVATTSFAIPHLAYPDGTTGAGLLGDLMLLEPDFRWGAYESNAAGKYRFEWVQWPTSVRYEADVSDGFSSPGSGDGLFNAVRVRWTDVKGGIRTTRRTSTVAELTAAGLTREAFLDLGTDIGNPANADQIGDQFLLQHADAPNAGRLTVARPIRDLAQGRMVMPWEIKAGELIRVRGVLPRIDALNPVARDGVTVFRIWSKEYSVARAAASLELDSSYLNTAQILADLARNRITRRR